MRSSRSVILKVFRPRTTMASRSQLNIRQICLSKLCRTSFAKVKPRSSHSCSSSHAHRAITNDSNCYVLHLFFDISRSYSVLQIGPPLHRISSSWLIVASFSGVTTIMCSSLMHTSSLRAILPRFLFFSHPLRKRRRS